MYLNKKFVTLLNYKNEEEKIETYTRQKLIDILDSKGYKTRKFYYPLPDYKLPNVIYSDLELPEYDNIGKYYPNHLEKSTILVDEVELFKEILKENKNMFTFFTNSFLVEASKNEFESKYKFISFNNMRKEKYRLITKISKECVEKENIYEVSNVHYQNLISNLEILKRANIKTLDEIQNEKIKSKYMKKENLLSFVLSKKIKENKLDEFYKILDEYFEILKSSSEKVQESNTIFDKYNIVLLEKDGLNFLKYALWDMTFDNCFYIGNEFYFFDQEWKSENMPAEYIFYRSIIYSNLIKDFIDINEVLKKYSLDKYIKEFRQLDEFIQKEIRDEKIWKYYKKDCYFDIDATIQELANVEIRSKNKDLAIENKNREMEVLKKKINKLENKNIVGRFKRKVGKLIRGINNE